MSGLEDWSLGFRALGLEFGEGLGLKVEGLRVKASDSMVQGILQRQCFQAVYESVRASTINPALPESFGRKPTNTGSLEVDQHEEKLKQSPSPRFKR